MAADYLYYWNSTGYCCVRERHEGNYDHGRVQYLWRVWRQNDPQEQTLGQSARRVDALADAARYLGVSPIPSGWRR